MSILYIRHPAKASVDQAPAGSPPACQFALAGDGGVLLQQGSAALGALGEVIVMAKRVVLLLAAADVTLLRVTVPPLSAARLRAALPSLVEEQVLGDPADCVLAAGPRGADGQRTVAVAQRSWLEALVKALLVQGARAVSVLPAQLCLPLAPGAAAAALLEGDDGLELTLRLAPAEGLGLSLPAEPPAALDTLRACAGEMPLTLYVAAPQVDTYRALALDAPAITVEPDHWAHWISTAQGAQPDLASALGAAGAQARDWRRWRWPLRLAVLAVAVNLIGINIEWLRLKREAELVRTSMLQTFKAAYPHETALDPVAQMRRNIASAQLDSGQVAPDEFTSLSAALGEAMAGLRGKGAVAALEYRERTLIVKIKPDTVDGAALARIRTALAARHLALSETGPGIWEIRVSTSPVAGAKS